MLFSSITFLYYFLPAVLIVYFLAPGKLKNAVLLLSSLLFYGWGEPKYVLLMLLCVLIFFLGALGMERCKSRRGKQCWLAGSIALGLALLGVFKYADFAIASVNAVTGGNLSLLRLALPIGISFYTFQCISYIVDVYRGDAKVQKNLLNFAAYVAMFPQLIAGPIVRYTDVAQALEHRKHSLPETAAGIQRFLLGLGKKVLLANNLGALIQVFRASGEKSVLFYWLYALAFTLHIYFDFSGYSDMAIGLGRVFGFHFPENFDYPYLSTSVTEFWRRWHISLGSWFRSYVYIPLGGNRVAKWKWVRNILIVWALTGAWHGAAWNFILWGLLFGVLLLVEKSIPAIGRLPVLLRRLGVMLVVILSFVLFNAESLAQAGTDFGGMFGLLELPAVTGETLYHLKSNAVLFLISAIGATPYPKRLFEKFAARWKVAAGILGCVFLLAMLLVCSAYLVDGSFNPFLYFRF